MKRLTFLAVALVGMLSLAACSDDVTAPTSGDVNAADANDKLLTPFGKTIAEVAEAQGFNLLLDAVTYIADNNPDSRTVSGLLDDSNLTVFAPTDEAFLNLVGAVSSLLDPEILENEGPFAAIDALLGEGTIEAVVSYHVTGGSQRAVNVVPVSGENLIKTLLPGATFMVTADGTINAVGNSASIIVPDVFASNGVIHAIDAVILPIDLDLGETGVVRAETKLDRVAY